MLFYDLFSRIGFKPVKPGIRPFFSVKKRANSDFQEASFQHSSASKSHLNSKNGKSEFGADYSKQYSGHSDKRSHPNGQKEVVSDRIPSSGIFGRVLKSGKASRVLFLYPGDYGSFIEDVHVTLIDGGIVHVQGAHEESTVHMQNCEIIWYMEPPTDDPDRTPDGSPDGPPNGTREGQSSEKSASALEKVIPFRKRQRHS